jgi:hypothetical protein
MTGRQDDRQRILDEYMIDAALNASAQNPQIGINLDILIE